MSEILVIAGPTASGKSELALALAREFGAEIVGADSRQIYRGMPVGTAAPTQAQQAQVRHHLTGFLDPHERYSAARFVADARAAIRDIHGRGKPAIVVGGTGFYLRALTGGVRLAPQHDEALRARLAHEARVHPPEVLHAWLAVRAPDRARAIAPGDAYRILRALEVALAGPQSRRGDVPPDPDEDPFAWHTIVLDVSLAELDERIARRTAAMLAGGFVEEAERIGAEAVAANAVGYPAALAYLRGWSTERELRDALERATRRYARRQRAWFRAERGAVWLDPGAAFAAAREKLRAPAKPA